MILKNLAAICRAHKRIFLYNDGRNSQWVGDGNTFYPMHGIPDMDEQTIQNVFDVPEKQRSKFVVNEANELPKTYDFGDVATLGETQLWPEELSIGYMDAILYPVNTSMGLAFYDPIYLKPLADKLPLIEMYERKTPGGSLYFAAKAGTFLEAIILPEDVNEEKLLDKLRDLTDDLETTLHYQTQAEEAQEEYDRLQLKVDPETGEVLA